MNKQNKSVLITCIIYAAICILLALVSYKYAHGDTIPTLPQFISTSTPTLSITQAVYGRPIKITGLSDGCLGLSSSLVVSSGSACGSGSGGVTSVGFSGGSTGLTFSNSPITTAATTTLSGILSVANGGTGTTTSTAFWTANGANIYNNNSGNVGIHDSNPTAPLQIIGVNSSSNPIFQVFKSNGFSSIFRINGDGSVLTGGNTFDDGQGNAIISSALAIGTFSNFNALDVSGAEALGTYAGTVFAPTGSLIASGSIGIGTSSPISKLSVIGNTYVAGNLTATGTINFTGLTSNGFVKTSGGTGALSIDTNTYLTGNQTITLSGDATGSGTTSIPVTLATVNANTGSFGSSTAIPNFTVNGKGLITAAGTNAVIAPAGTLSGTTLNSAVVSSSLTSVGTLGSLTMGGTTTYSDNSTKTSNCVAIFQDQKTATTAGGGSVVGYQVRTLNTTVQNNCGATLGSNQVTLPAGTYMVLGSVPSFGGDRQKALLYNVTDAATTTIGTDAFSDNSTASSVSFSQIMGYFTISSQKTFEIMQFITTARATNGLGLPMSTSQGTEVYTTLQFQKI